MSRRDGTPRAAAAAANKVDGSRAGGPPTAVGGPQAGDALSPDLIREVYGVVSRVIKAANVDAVAGECGVDRSTVFKWAKKPHRTFIGALPVLAEYDPDLEGVERVAACLMAIKAKRALAREAQRRLAAVTFYEAAPGKVVR